MKIRNRVKELRMVPAKDLLANPKNWREHPKEQADAMREVLESVGFAGAVLARETPEGLMLIDGHLRKETAPDATVPVLVLDVTEKEADTILATFDPISAMATANGAGLRALVESLDLNTGALSAMLDETIAEAAKGLGGTIVEDEAPAPLPDPVSKTGDLWLMGEHRLLCGDSTKGEDVEKLMDGDRASLLATSPPYADARTYGGANVEVATLCGFISAWAPSTELMAVNLGIIRRDNAVVQYWNEYIAAAAAVGLLLLSWNVWDRNQPWSLAQNTAMFPIEHEWVFVFGRSTKSLNLTVENKSPGKRTGITNRQTDGSLKRVPTKEIRTHRPLGTVFRSNPHIGKDIGHPAMFPVALPAAYIESCTSAGEIVGEPFSGSGTTIIAAEQLARKCYAIEIEPRYVDVAVRRWQKLTGREATHAETGKTWTEMATERGIDITE